MQRLLTAIAAAALFCLSARGTQHDTMGLDSKFQSENQNIMSMDTIDLAKTYKAPQIKVFEVKVQGVLCQSMYEKDYGDGGFEEQ